jgi:hypothetical protein
VPYSSLFSSPCPSRHVCQHRRSRCGAAAASPQKAIAGSLSSTSAVSPCSKRASACPSTTVGPTKLSPSPLPAPWFLASKLTSGCTSVVQAVLSPRCTFAQARFRPSPTVASLASAAPRTPACLQRSGLTLRSSADLHRQGALAARLCLPMIRLAAKPPYRRRPLSSNVTEVCT